MSQYSDFFGVAGGGGGAPINSYEAFFVSGSGNPTGYNGTTGLYTQADGTVWLRTGFVLDAATTYPNATTTPGIVYTGTTATVAPFVVDSNAPIGSRNKLLSDGTNYYISTPGGNYTIRQLDSTFASTGYSLSFGPGFAGQNRNMFYPIYDSPAFGSASSNTLQKSVPPSTAFPTQFTHPTTLGVAGTNSTGTEVYITPGGSATAVAYNFPGGTGTPNTITVTSGGQISAIGAYGNYMVTTDSNGFIEVFDVSGGGPGQPSVAQGSISSGTYHNMMTSITPGYIWIGESAGTFSTLYQYNVEANTVGDITARTNSDSSQPLFIKLA